MRIADVRHAFVTGGASGFGLAVALALADRGARVTIADANEEALGGVLGKRQAGLRGVRLDVRDREGWARARSEAEAEFGPIDLLFANAGIAPDGTQIADMAAESFDRMIAINLTGVFNAVATFAAAMREAGRGHIVATSSMSGMAADNQGLGSYAPAKFGVVAMMEVLRREMAPHGVAVSAFCPGTTATGLMENTRRIGGELQYPDASLRDYPVTPEDVVPLILRGIEDDRLYIFTHPERRAAVEERFAGIMAGFDAL